MTPIQEEIAGHLEKHWLTELLCDHENKTDKAACYCGWLSGTEPCVGAAAKAWAVHVAQQFPRSFGYR